MFPTLRKFSPLESDQKSAKEIAEKSVTESEVLLIKHQKRKQIRHTCTKMSWIIFTINFNDGERAKATIYWHLANNLSECWFYKWSAWEHRKFVVVLQLESQLYSSLYLISEAKSWTPFHLLIRFKKTRWWEMNVMNDVEMVFLM